MSRNIRLACFDLDGTLVRGDTLLPFLASYALKNRRWWLLVPMAGWLLLLALRLTSARNAKQGLLRLILGGAPVAAVDAHAEWFWNHWVKHRLIPESLAKLRAHQAVGDRVILISASPDVYVRTIGARLGIQEILCTMVERSGTTCLGGVVGENCKGPHKLERLREHLGSEALPPGSVAYGDSRSDLPLLRAFPERYLVRGGVLSPVLS